MTPIIKLISDTYGMTTTEENTLTGFDDKILQQSLIRFAEKRKQQNISDPVKYIIAIARDLISKGSQIPKTGRQMDYSQKKVVNGSFNPNHSPTVEAPKMTDNERIGSLMKEISSFKEKIANPQKYFLPNVDVESALEVGRAFLAAREQELEDLLRPPVRIIDKPEKDMTPEEWLIWNRERKIQRLKEQKNENESLLR